MLLALVFLAIIEPFALHYVYAAWLKPLIVERANWPFEPGPDDAVSWREMMRRSAWRYDSWTDRIMSLLAFVLLNAFVVFTVIGGQ